MAAQERQLSYKLDPDKNFSAKDLVDLGNWLKQAKSQDPSAFSKGDGKALQALITLLQQPAPIPSDRIRQETLLLDSLRALDKAFFDKRCRYKNLPFAALRYPGTLFGGSPDGALSFQISGWRVQDHTAEKLMFVPILTHSPVKSNPTNDIKIQTDAIATQLQIPYTAAPSNHPQSWCSLINATLKPLGDKIPLAFPNEE